MNKFYISTYSNQAFKKFSLGSGTMNAKVHKCLRGTKTTFVRLSTIQAYLAFALFLPFSYFCLPCTGETLGILTWVTTDSDSFKMLSASIFFIWRISRWKKRERSPTNFSSLSFLNFTNLALHFKYSSFVDQLFCFFYFKPWIDD